jgi:hypothetical protein
MDEIFYQSLKVIIPTVIIVIILIIIAFILYKKNKKVHRVLTSEKKRLLQYKEGIQKLNNADFESPEKYFDYLNKYVRGFFKEYYDLDYSLTYLELREVFRKLDKEDYSKFCEKMSNVDYSGIQKKNNEIRDLSKEFLRIIEKF